MSHALTINHLTKNVSTDRGQSKTLLHNISLHIPTGSIYGLLGPNGAGKTTLIKCIMGLMHTPNNTITITTNELSYAPDKTQLYPFLTAREQMRMIYDIHKLPSKPARNHIDKLLNQVGLDPANNTRIGNYSSGMKKRLGLAMSLIADPDLIIRDEPMAGVDPLGRITIKQLIHKLIEQGKTLLFSTHILSDVAEVADHIAIIDQGHILHTGALADINQGLEEFFAETVAHAH